MSHSSTKIIYCYITVVYTVWCVVYDVVSVDCDNCWFGVAHVVNTDVCNSFDVKGCIAAPKI